MDIHFYYRTDLVHIVCEKLPGVEKAYIELLLDDYSYFTQFHNKYHAVSVFLIAHRLTEYIPMETLERELFLLICLGHDMGHPGLTNKVLEKTNHSIYRLYDEFSGSFLEYYHYSRFINWLETTNLIHTYRHFLTENILGFFLATDLANYHRYSGLLYDVLHIADLGGGLWDVQIHELIKKQLYNEFKDMNQYEIQYGMVPDKTVFSLLESKNEIEFLETYLLPSLENFAEKYPAFKNDILYQNYYNIINSEKSE